MKETMARSFTLAFMILFSLSNQVGGNDNCPLASSNLIRLCKPVTVTNKNRYTIEFSDFQLADEDSCQCSFIAPSHGDFDMAPTSFTAVNNCGTKVEVSISNVVVNGGSTECKPAPLLPASVLAGEKVTVTVSRTSTSSKIAPYCYVATFPTNVTFTCTSSATSQSTSVTTRVTTTTLSTTTTVQTTPTIPITTTIPTTTTPATFSSSSPTSLTATNPSSTSDIRKDPSTTGKEESFPVVIVIPAAVGAVVVILLIIIVAVVCIRRSRSTKQTTTGVYENEVFNDKDSSSDGIKDNILYNGMVDNVPHRESGGDGHYSSVIRHSSKLDEEPHNMKQLPQPANQQAETQGPVYAVVDKSQKRPSGPPVASKPLKSAQNNTTDAPVYAVPDKSQIKSKQKINSEYDVPQNNSPVSIPSPPIRTSNQDELLYSEVQHVGPIPDLPTRKSDSKPAHNVIYSEIRTEL